MPGRTGSRAASKNVCKCGGFALYKKTTYLEPHGIQVHSREGCMPVGEWTRKLTDTINNKLESQGIKLRFQHATVHQAFLEDSKRGSGFGGK